ncbi:hypothetical protein MHYP_G00129100 [Metynnis hypsauchen]
MEPQKNGPNSCYPGLPRFAVAYSAASGLDRGLCGGPLLCLLLGWTQDPRSVRTGAPDVSHGFSKDSKDCLEELVSLFVQ